MTDAIQIADRIPAEFVTKMFRYEEEKFYNAGDSRIIEETDTQVRVERGSIKLWVPKSVLMSDEEVFAIREEKARAAERRAAMGEALKSGRFRRTFAR